MLFLTFLSLLSACSVKKKIEEPPIYSDRDGDGMDDQEERELGRNPFIADLPELQVSFLQNYSISIHYLENGEEKIFEIDTKVGRGMADFQYRVGGLLAQHLAHKEAARIGSFNSHHFGDFAEQDLTWVGYPQIDERFYLESMSSFNPDWEIQNIVVKLENSIKLKDNGLYSSIKNLEITFRYYDYELESYVNLGTKKIERHFSAGVNETFEVVLENVPINLVRDSYFWRGEFIISEIKNYEIPQINATYKTLLSQIRERTVPVVYNTPIENKIYYVALGEQGEKSFHGILKSIFDKQFSIVEDRLEKIEQFSNNLRDYTYLQEVREHDKEGRWFVFTSPIKRHYLDHNFGHLDKIALSYITGNVLARQKKHVIQSFEILNSSTDSKILEIGEVTANAQIHLHIRPQRRWGEKAIVWEEVVKGGGYCGKNCIALKPYQCHLKFSKFEQYSENLIFSEDLGREFSRLSLFIDGREFNLKALIDKKQATLERSGGHLYLQLRNPIALVEAPESLKYRLGIKMAPFSETISNGVLLEGWKGENKRRCPLIALQATVVHDLPISPQSLEFEQWKHLIRPELTAIGEDKTYFQHFSLTLSVIVINHFN